MNITALNTRTDYWAGLMMNTSGMYEIARMLPGSSSFERTAYPDFSDACEAYLRIVSEMFSGDERMEEMRRVMDEVIGEVDSVDMEWVGASEAEMLSGDVPVLCIYDLNRFEDYAS